MEILVVIFSNIDGYLWMGGTHLALDNDEDDDYCGISGSKGDQTKLVYLAISLLTPLGGVEPLYLTFLLFKMLLIIPTLHFCTGYLKYISSLTPFGQYVRSLQSND